MAAVAAVALAMGASAAFGSDASAPLTVYTEVGQAAPRYRLWSGGGWGAEGSANSVGGVPQWLLARNCPTRDEYALATLDVDNDVNVQFYTGAWSAVSEVCTNTGTYAGRPFDLAYEGLSGDLLIVYWNHGAQRIAYRTFNGTTLSGETKVVPPWPANVRWVRLVSRPYSDEIGVIALPDCGCLWAGVWGGATLGKMETLNESVATNDSQFFDAAFESRTGRLMVGYAVNGSNTPRFRMWNGAAWGTEANIGNIGGVARWLRLERDPGSDAILMVAADQKDDLNFRRWSGTAWSDVQELETSLSRNDVRQFDLAYQADGAQALLTYTEGALTQVRYRTWNGAAWSAEGSGPSFGDVGAFIKLSAAPTGSAVYSAVLDAGFDIEAQHWSGTAFGGNTQLEGDASDNTLRECMIVAAPAASPPTPAATPYFTDFESGAGAEWSNSALENNGTYGKFVGRYRGVPLRLALYTTVGETYSLTFDLYAIDSWDGTPATYGPDSLIVTIAGTPVFNHTFIHDPGWMQDGCTYPHPADQYGHYGYNGGWTDGIFRRVETVFTATAATTTLSFYASLTDENAHGFDDESWGIDNVSVQSARFVDVSAARGFNVTTTSGYDWGSGIHWADLDNDGDLDAILGGTTARQLTSNNAGQSFSSTSLGTVYRHGAWLDIDNDDDIDFWSVGAGHYNTEACYQNNGSAVLANAGALSFSDPTNNEGGAAADVNGDGWCDVVMFSENGNWIGHHQGATPAALVATTSSTYGLNGSGSVGNGDYASSGDVNNDGFLDFLYHYNSGRLFLSNGDGTYTRNNYGVTFNTSGTDKIGSAWGDYDNDGDLDLFVPRVTPGYTGYLFRNDRDWSAGTGSFTDVTSAAGFNLNGKPAYSANLGTRGATWGDCDNDGDLDLFIAGANGNHYLYQNQGNGTFARVGEGIVADVVAHDACFVDYDNDGDLDLSMTADATSAVLFENRTNNGNYLKVRVIGRGAGGTNKAAIGTRVELWNAAGTTRLARRDVGTARGYGGTEPLWLHFGGVNPATTYTVKVYFKSRPVSDPYSVTVQPNTESTTIGSTTIPQMLTVTEPAGVRVIRWREVRNPDPGP